MSSTTRSDPTKVAIDDLKTRACAQAVANKVGAAPCRQGHQPEQIFANLENVADNPDYSFDITY